jgi:hypothetical protein
MTVDKAVCVCASLAHNVKDDNVAALCWERHRQAVEQHEQSAIQLVNELSESANWRMGLAVPQDESASSGSESTSPICVVQRPSPFSSLPENTGNSQLLEAGLIWRWCSAPWATVASR